MWKDENAKGATLFRAGLDDGDPHSREDRVACTGRDGSWTSLTMTGWSDEQTQGLCKPSRTHNLEL